MTVRVTTSAIGPHRRHPRDGASRERRARRLGRRRVALGTRRASTASRISSSTWPSRARRRARPLEIAEEIEAVGGEVNAATSVETTSYYARVLKDDVPLALDILSDILRNSVFDPDELEREQHVILQEIGAALDTPDDRVYDLFAEAAYPGQPIGRNILGTPETVQAAASPMLDAYLDRHYRGPAMVLAAAGARRPRPARRRWPSERFGDLAGDAGPDAGRRRPIAAATRARTRDLHGDPDHARLRGPCPTRRDDFYTAQVLASILGGGMSSRLFQEVREKRGLCYSIYAFHWSFADTGIFGVHAATGPERRRRADAGDRSASSSAPPHDIDERELDRARAQLRAGLLMTLESPAARAGQIARQILLFGRADPDRGTGRARSRRSRVADVRDLAGDIFTGSAPTLAAVGAGQRHDAATTGSPSASARSVDA